MPNPGRAAQPHERLDEIAAAATLAPLNQMIDGWWCKAAPDLPFRRCNAVLPRRSAADDRARFDGALSEVRAWYRDLGLRLIIQVSSADPTCSGLDSWLAGEGLDIEAPVDVMTADLASLVTEQEAADSQEASGRRVTLQVGVDHRWVDDYGAIHGAEPGQRERVRSYGQMLTQHGEQGLAVSVGQGDRAVGVGFGVLDGSWVGLFGMGTVPAQRRQGVASAVVASLARGALEAGATRAYLQVETDNAAAIALYRGLGFTRHHGYHYRSVGLDPDLGC